jgi:hypothetical protein
MSDAWIDGSMSRWENLWTCDTCGVLVAGDQKPVHDKWHDDLSSVIANSIHEVLTRMLVQINPMVETLLRKFS